MAPSVIHLPVLKSGVAEIASEEKGFHLGCLTGSYPRHQSYHDCPPRLCLSQQAQPPNPSNIRRCHRPAFEGKKTTTNSPRMCNPSESTRQCQWQTTFCVLAAAAPRCSGWFRETHACLSSPWPPAHIKPRRTSYTPISKLFCFFLKDYFGHL